MTDEKTALEYRQAPINTQLQRAGYRRTDYVDDYNINGAEEEGIQVDWTKWARAVFRRKRLIAAAVAVGTALSLFVALRTRDAYQAYTVISVGKEDTPVIKFREGDLIIQNDESLKTKMYLLQSNPLIEEVIVNMKLDRSEDILNPGGRTLRETFNGLSARVKNAYQGRRNMSEPAPNIPDSLSTPAAQPATEPQYSPAESWRLTPFVEIFRKNLSVEPASDAWLKNFSAGPVSDTPITEGRIHAFRPCARRGHLQSTRPNSDHPQRREQVREIQGRVELAGPLDARSEGQGREGRTGDGQLHPRA